MLALDERKQTLVIQVSPSVPSSHPTDNDSVPRRRPQPGELPSEPRPGGKHRGLQAPASLRSNEGQCPSSGYHFASSHAFLRMLTGHETKKQTATSLRPGRGPSPPPPHATYRFQAMARVGESDRPSRCVRFAVPAGGPRVLAVGVSVDRSVREGLCLRGGVKPSCTEVHSWGGGTGNLQLFLQRGNVTLVVVVLLQLILACFWPWTFPWMPPCEMRGSGRGVAEEIVG